MALTQDQVKELVETIKLHVDWALFALIGPKAISDQDLQSLKQSGLLPLGTTAALVQNSFILGILQSLLERGQWQGLTYEELLQEAVRTHTPIEQLAIQAAELEAGSALKRLFTDIAEGAYQQLAKVQHEVINEATIRGIIQDRVKLALLERKSYQQLASELAHTLETDWRRDWRRVAETELQRAKVRGHVHAIVNKVDVYKDSDGPDSRVSIVPAPDACEDCKHHYLEEDGNPKVFKLADLIAAGSNADPGVSHKRSEGKHHHWKTTLPPLHPRCGCNITIVPDGFHWQAGKLRAIKPLTKGVGSPTVVPKGPPQTPGVPKPPSLPGLAAPGNEPGPGRPPSMNSSAKTTVSGGGPKSSGQKIKYEYWSGPGQPPPDGGWEQSETGAWRRPVGQGGVGGAPPPPVDVMAHASPITQQDPAELIMAAQAWAKTPKPRQVVQDHMTHGDFGHVQELGGGTPAAGHLNKVYKVAIVGNGNALWKPQPDKVGAETPRPGVVPASTEYIREEAAAKLDNLLELGICPPTSTRSYGGASGSLQAWAEGATHLSDYVEPPEASFKGEDDPDGIPMHAVVKGDKFNPIKAVLEKHPELQEEFSKMVVFDIISNNTDRHHDNYMLSKGEDGKMKVVGIDNGLSFGNGLNGYRSWVHRDLYKAGYKVKIPEDLQTRLKGLTHGDYLRSMNETSIDPWAATQSYIRTKYLLDLQEKEGHLDFDHFVFVMRSPDFGAVDDNDDYERQQQKKGGTTDDLFHKWAGTYLYTAATTPDHPDHEVAKTVLADYDKYFPSGEAISNPDYALTVESLKDSDQEMNDVAYTAEDDGPVDAFGATPVRKKPAPALTLDNPFGSVGKPLHPTE